VKIRWSAEANEDRVAIFDFIEMDNPRAAGRIDDKFLDAVERLKTFPKLGRPGRRSGTRELPVPGTPYIVAYRIHSDEIEMLHILHGSQHWPDLGP
jgi:toxin ParE1/3/4